MAKSIMIQGTMSNAGKSLIAAGLCRIFTQDGYNVSPFKSQNMALNSCITEAGLEMGRAQVVQAEACKKKPHVWMNPVLLKPTSDMGSQVIVLGKVQGNMRAMDYYKKKKDYIPLIKEAYDNLAAQSDIVVIEGAGSPAEINLKENDIVNMGLAKMVDAPVLLVGDIDRGGVFAQLLGTLELLEADERSRIKGLIVNKFRGDAAILKPGIQMLEERCKKKVLGIVPYLDVDIEEEDSLAKELEKRNVTAAVDIAVIKLRKISNFTDFQALSIDEGVSVRYVEKPSELGNPHMIILPGSKNTVADMKWLRESGLEALILRHAGKGTLIFGICGGFQLLGRRIVDGAGVEGGGEIRGMGLLPVTTCFEEGKTQRCRDGKTIELSGPFASLSHKQIKGYEIHMGKTVYHEEKPEYFLETDNGFDGCVKENVAGSYFHGIFDHEDFRKAFLSLLYERCGLGKYNKEILSFQAYKEQQYDRLADALRESMDMKEIYRILGISKC